MPEQTPPVPLDVAKDTGPFAQIGCALNTEGSTERWVASSYASPLAFYIVMQHKSLSNYLAVATGGAIGGAISGFFGSGRTAERTCRVSALPDTVRAAIDPSGSKASCDVIVIPRQSINTVKFVGFGVFAVSVNLTVGRRKLLLATGIFSGMRIKRELSRLRWLPSA